VTGYKLKYGTASRSYSQTRDVGKVTFVTPIPLLSPVTYFVVTAYNANGESGPSNEVHWP
jgi:hypothetical protein